MASKFSIESILFGEEKRLKQQLSKRISGQSPDSDNSIHNYIVKEDGADGALASSSNEHLKTRDQDLLKTDESLFRASGDASIQDGILKLFQVNMRRQCIRDAESVPGCSYVDNSLFNDYMTRLNHHHHHQQQQHRRHHHRNYHHHQVDDNASSTFDSRLSNQIKIPKDDEDDDYDDDLTKNVACDDDDDDDDDDNDDNDADHSCANIEDEDDEGCQLSPVNQRAQSTGDSKSYHHHFLPSSPSIYRQKISISDDLSPKDHQSVSSNLSSPTPQTSPALLMTTYHHHQYHHRHHHHHHRLQQQQQRFYSVPEMSSSGDKHATINVQHKKRSRAAFSHAQVVGLLID